MIPREEGRRERHTGRFFSVSLIIQPCCSVGVFCGIPQASSPWCTPVGHACLWCCGTGHQAGHRTVQLHRALGAVSGSWGYVGIIIGLLFLSSFYFICMCPTNKAGSENIDTFAKGCLILLPRLTCISQPLEEHSYGVSRVDLVGLHWCKYLKYYLSFKLSVLIPFVVVDEETQSFIPFFFVLSVFTHIHDIFIFVSEIPYV